MGAVQKLATVVIVGLVALATLLVVLVANEPNRRDEEVEEKAEVSVERGIATYLANCLLCHGPGGEGSSAGDGRIGLPLGGNTVEGRAAQELNQSEDESTRIERRRVMWEALHLGRGLMPAWGKEKNGQLNDEQIEELIEMIQNVDWDLVYNDAIEQAGGAYPTAPPPAARAAAQAQPAQAPPGGAQGSPATPGAGEPQSGAEEAGAGGPPPGGGPPPQTVTSVDIAFDPDAVTIPADTDVPFNLPNQGGVGHNFSIDALDISVDQPPGSNESTVINAPAGEYEYYCNVPGHAAAGMVGTLTVE